MASEKTGSHRATAGARLLASRYRLVERIDEGGAGEVWRARDEKLDRDVAIKLLGPDADDAFRARFADEARRAAAVVHPNVVTVFDEGRSARSSPSAARCRRTRSPVSSGRSPRHSTRLMRPASSTAT